MKDIMIDLETMGTTPNSVIVQIGACYFDRISGKTGCEFLMNVSMKSCMDLGLTMDASTVEWWLNKTNRSFLQQPIHDVKEVFDYLFNFCNKCKCVWAHATFDFPILMNAYNKINYNLPFSFRDCRDLRTLVDLAGIPYKKSDDRTDQENKHNALDDCIYQVGYATKCFNILTERTVDSG